MKHRTTHRSTTGTKLYAVRDSRGRFQDIQTYNRMIKYQNEHQKDLNKKSIKMKKKNNKYIAIESGKWYPYKKKYVILCCRCGKKEMVEIKVDKQGKIWQRVWR